MNRLGTRLLLILLVAALLVATPDPFTAKHFCILASALLVVFGTPVLKALLIRLHLW